MATYSFISTDSIVRNPTSLPFPTQTGIASNCDSWMQAFGTGDTCHWFAGRANMIPRVLYEMNPFLGANGENCPMQFWADYWYCVGTATGQVVATQTGPLTVTTTAIATQTQGPIMTTKPVDVGIPGVTTAASVNDKSTTPPPSSTTSTFGPVIAAPQGSTYLGCASEAPGRALKGPSTAQADMTVEKCLAFCSNAGYALAGLEYGSECFCGDALAAPSALHQDGCTMPCSGSSKGDQVCGGPGRLSVYQSLSVPVPAIPQTVSGYGYRGCYDESRGRLLAAAMVGDDRLTVDMCVAFCNGNGFPYAGVEYARECWCATDLSQSAPKLEDGRCGMKCKGNGGQLCGGHGALAVYKKGDAKRAVHQHTGPGKAVPTVVKTIRLVRRGRFGRRQNFA